MRIVIRISRQRKRALTRRAGKVRDAALRIRYLVIIGLAEGETSVTLAAQLKVARSTVSRRAARFLEEGEPGLRDRRANNGQLKADETVEWWLRRMLRKTPRYFGWRRPTWTRELLVETLYQELGVRLSVWTVGRALRRLRARRGRPRPVVRCPWPKHLREARIKELHDLIAHLPRDEIVFYEDEVDIHLNPKIGLDWMLYGQQKLVVTPGNNVKRYIPGALDPRQGQIVWVPGDCKKSQLFIDLVEELVRRYRRYRIIHITLDNYSIHHSKLTQQAVPRYGGRVVLHFLPPYNPNDNPIKRLWQELHASTTRNHTCKTIQELMTEVTRTIKALPPYPGSSVALARAA